MSNVEAPADLFQTYAADGALHRTAAEECKRFLDDLVREASIDTHDISARAKEYTSFCDKASKRRSDGRPKYEDPLREISDCVAARVILYTSRARDDLADLLSRRARVKERINPGSIKHNGYDSEHFVITAIYDRSFDDQRSPGVGSDRRSRSRYPRLAEYLDKYSGLEIQLRSVAAHAWAEYEHDIRYKSEAYRSLPNDRRAQIDQLFVEAGGLRKFMDSVFDQIQGILLVDGPSDVDDTEPAHVGDVAGERARNDPGSRIDTGLEPGNRRREDVLRDVDGPLLPDGLRALIAQRFPDADPGSDEEITELAAHLQRLGLTTVESLKDQLGEDAGAAEVAALMEYPRDDVSGARRLDDEMLTKLADRYVRTAPTEGRRRLLELRRRRVNGKFNIYSVEKDGRVNRPVSASRVVRNLVVAVARDYGTDLALVPGVIASTPADLQERSLPIRVSGGELYIVDDLDRSRSEDAMRSLLNNVQGSGYKVRRAGDLLAEAPPANRS